jgi:hypothetical protein
MSINTSRNLLNHILNNNQDSADVVTQHLLSQKLDQAKESKKLAIASKLYNNKDKSE